MVFWLILAAVIFIIAASGIKIIRPFEKGLVERLGKYRRDANPGLQFIIPFIERMVKVDLRETVIDVPPQEVITKDNVVVTVDAIIYYQITDAFRVVYNVSNFEIAAIKLAQTNLRNVIGEMELDQTLTSRERINVTLREVLDEATDKWGVKVTRVEIKKIDPPQDIMDAMSKQMKAERTKRAVILEAEGYKQSEITKAEGDKMSAILQAEGQSESIKRVAEANKFKLIAEAEGQANATINVFKAIHEGDPTKDVIAIRYLDALKQIADGKANKVFLPFESSAMLSSLGSMAEIFKDGKDSSSVNEKESKK
ncbi:MULTISPECIES: SPFH domain-containing protein [Mesotoga]|jgi:regulator of protease activity HflC (stomatin/prohibitin superfamily)|uniref:Membrane protease subunit, stomatin/prohibitin n=1 Tax=Mesotoga prima MesG1.Ag.4.2 TaxID=660470 RepID=I2F409_9BACT|nr:MULTISPECIES: SPFH domain-containing protein [Mesotoga]AFK06662.1 membrane protease subunit, stomatin/prohibitin [Mesotoga prima MesG1.Ag.4.2]MDD3681292.1 SPFH/Band 7/PHB domain protein [Mesotoga sp.]MDD4207481.1 SPFH/Band 7/PHB domain protein [Mesotoga sp.]MDD4825752.1 SPFH/Band 7/PHB domain protein [Mesotoga sp.]MDD5683046.1 SPFH/Band 7/PHB domain protein [Mesotoga sp.]